MISLNVDLANSRNGMSKGVSTVDLLPDLSLSDLKWAIFFIAPLVASIRKVEISQLFSAHTIF